MIAASRLLSNAARIFSKPALLKAPQYACTNETPVSPISVSSFNCVLHDCEVSDHPKFLFCVFVPE